MVIGYNIKRSSATLLSKPSAGCVITHLHLIICSFSFHFCAQSLIVRSPASNVTKQTVTLDGEMFVDIGSSQTVHEQMYGSVNREQRSATINCKLWCARAPCQVALWTSRRRVPSVDVDRANHSALRLNKVIVLISTWHGRRPESIRGLFLESCRRPSGIAPPMSLLNTDLIFLINFSVRYVIAVWCRLMTVDVMERNTCAGMTRITLGCK